MNKTQWECVLTSNLGRGPAVKTIGPFDSKEDCLNRLFSLTPEQYDEQKAGNLWGWARVGEMEYAPDCVRLPV